MLDVVQFFILERLFLFFFCFSLHRYLSKILGAFFAATFLQIQTELFLFLNNENVLFTFFVMTSYEKGMYNYWQYVTEYVPSNYDQKNWSQKFLNAICRICRGTTIMKWFLLKKKHQVVNVNIMSDVSVGSVWS